LRLIWHIGFFSLYVGLARINKHKLIQLGLLIPSCIMLFLAVQIWIDKQTVLVENKSTRLGTNANIEKLLHVQKIKQEQLQQLVEEYQHFENADVKSRNFYYNLAALETANGNKNTANEYLKKTLQLEPRLTD